MDASLILPGALIVLGSLVVARLLLRPGGVTIDDLLMRPDLAWPRGVQEEEPVPWRFERLTPPGHRRAARLAAGLAARPTHARLRDGVIERGARRPSAEWNWRARSSTHCGMTKGRLEAFSDGVLAIIITIMVLELRPPEETTLEALRPLIPAFLSATC